MKTNKLIIAAILGASFLGLSGSANAACSFTGKVERVYQNSSSTYIYMLPVTSINSSYYRWFRTSDPDLARAAHAAKDGQQNPPFPSKKLQKQIVNSIIHRPWNLH